MLTILWHNPESAGYTDHIEVEWLSRNSTRQAVSHLVTGPRSGKYVAKCDLNVRGDIVDLDYRPYEDLNTTHGMFVGVMRIQFVNPSRKHVSQVLWKDKGDEQFRLCSTTVAFTPDDPQDFDSQVAASMGLSMQERLKRLASARNKPRQSQIISTVFIRNPNVVAHVLNRAQDKCERCENPAPFNRASDGRPYLEIHHIVRLADCGDDTIKNAVALCPNCHREAHYG